MATPSRIFSLCRTLYNTNTHNLSSYRRNIHNNITNMVENKSITGRPPKSFGSWKRRVDLYENGPEHLKEECVDGCDFRHWRIYTKPLRGSPTKDEIIQFYRKTLSQLLGSEEEAEKKIYSVATRDYYAFGAEITPEQADQMAGIKNVLQVMPDSFVEQTIKRYPCDPFINGQALPCGPQGYLTDDVAWSESLRYALCDTKYVPTGRRVVNRLYAEVKNAAGVPNNHLSKNSN